MLGKLIKYEWKAVWKFLTVINVFLIIITAVGCLSFYSPMYTSDMNYVDHAALFVLIFYYLSLFAVSIATTIYIAIRFYKNMYTNEGYLSHTLPVTPAQHILSKGIVAFIWTTISFLMVAMSIIVLMICLVLRLSPDNPIPWNEIRTGMTNFFVQSNISFPIFMILLILYLIIATISGILMIYGAISIGQLFNRHKVISSIAIYFGLTTILQIIYSAFSTVFAVQISKMTYAGSTHNGSVTLQTDMPNFIGDFFFKFFWAGLLISVIISIIMFILNNYIMKKKLNLD